MGTEGVMGAEEDKGAAIYLMLDGQDTTGIGYMALWGFAAKFFFVLARSQVNLLMYLTVEYYFPTST